MSGSRLDLMGELQNLIYEGSVSGAPKVRNTDAQTKTVSEQDPAVRSANLKSLYESAYPDLLFNIETTGDNVRITSSPREKNNVSSSALVPSGFSPKLASAGIADLQASLEKATTDKEKLEIAFKLKAMVATTKSVKFQEYKSRAEAEFGIPDILLSIDNIKRAEMLSSNNPGNGMPSRERLALISSLGVARTHAANRIKEMSDNDTAFAAAENLADATISALRIGSVLDERQARQDARDEKAYAREAAIVSLQPEFLTGISTVRFNNPAPDQKTMRSIAEQLVDGKLRLSETEKVLAGADADSLKGLYVGLKDPKEKEMAFRLIEAKELALNPDKTQAKLNVQLFKEIFAKDLTNLKDAPGISKRYKQRVQEISIQMAGASTREKDQEMQRMGVAIRNEYLGEIVKREFNRDISRWGGLIQSDETAKAIMLQHRGDKVPLSITRFIDEYNAYNDGKDKGKKSQAIQAIIVSAVEALPRSVVLPIMSPESALLEAQRMTASQSIKEALKDYSNLLPSMMIAKTVKDTFLP